MTKDSNKLMIHATIITTIIMNQKVIRSITALVISFSSMCFISLFQKLLHIFSG